MKIDLDLLQTTIRDHQTKLAQMSTTTIGRRARSPHTTPLQHHITRKLLSLTSRKLALLLHQLSDTIRHHQRPRHRNSLRRLPQRIKPLLKLAPHIRTLKLMNPTTMPLRVPPLILSTHPLPPRRKTRLQTLVVPPIQNLDTRIPPHIHSLNRTRPILRKPHLRLRTRSSRRDSSHARQNRKAASTRTRIKINRRITPTQTTKTRLTSIPGNTSSAS
jgi:hypothetical protein